MKSQKGYQRCNLLLFLVILLFCGFPGFGFANSGLFPRLAFAHARVRKGRQVSLRAQNQSAGGVPQQMGRKSDNVRYTHKLLVSSSPAFGFLKSGLFLRLAFARAKGSRYRCVPQVAPLGVQTISSNNYIFRYNLLLLSSYASSFVVFLESTFSNSGLFSSLGLLAPNFCSIPSSKDVWAKTVRQTNRKRSCSRGEASDNDLID